MHTPPTIDLTAAPISVEEAVARLNAIVPGADAEQEHVTADDIIIAALPVEIRAAYARVVQQASFWAFA